MWRWLVCILRNLLPTWLDSQNRWCRRRAPPIRLPTACTCSTCQQAPNRTLLSFPNPEDHRVDLPRNKCPASDNTHGAPRVAPKSCPPKKQANHPPINCHYPQKVSLLSVKLKALLRHLILNHSWGGLFGNLSHAHFPYRTPQKSRLKKSQKTVVSCSGDSIRTH